MPGARLTSPFRQMTGIWKSMNIYVVSSWSQVKSAEFCSKVWCQYDVMRYYEINIYIYINMRFLPFNGRLRYLLYFSKFFPKSGRHCLEDNFQTFLDDAELQKCGHAGAHQTYGTMLGRKVPYLLDGWDDRTVEADWSLSINADSWWTCLNWISLSFNIKIIKWLVICMIRKRARQFQKWSVSLDKFAGLSSVFFTFPIGGDGHCSNLPVAWHVIQ